ncbi:hypothetical protein B7494_g3408 [Chlorociboria aeruginascens]|nr:hypothetical protein B7494_g3408 [Chlorociboria aeruginascens]
MSKLSSALKALIRASFACPNTVPAPENIRSVYARLQQEAASRDVGESSWLALSTAATMTMNSPESLSELYSLATTSSKDKRQAVNTAEFMREVPRTINCLGAFRASLPVDIISRLSTEPTRVVTAENINAIKSRGQNLWKSIYAPFDSKLIARLADSHPDLPVHIVSHEYGGLFSDPEGLGHVRGAKVGRVLTSIVAVACLRAQTGVGPQVTSHVFGLRKAYEDGSYQAEGEFEVEGGQWLASDEGNIWLLNSVDTIVKELGVGRGSTFAPGMSKL